MMRQTQMVVNNRSNHCLFPTSDAVAVARAIFILENISLLKICTSPYVLHTLQSSGTLFPQHIVFLFNPIFLIHLPSSRHFLIQCRPTKKNKTFRASSCSSMLSKYERDEIPKPKNVGKQREVTPAVTSSHYVHGSVSESTNTDSLDS